MCLMESRKLLDAHVFNGQQEMAKPTLQAFFSLFYTYLELKNIHCSTSFCRKKDSHLYRKKETETIKEKRELLFVCYIVDIYYSLNSFYSLNRPKVRSLFVQHCGYIQ